MKTIVKIEIVLLVLVVLVGAGMVLLSEGFLEWFQEPVIQERSAAPIAAEEPAETLAPEDTLPEETQAGTEGQEETQPEGEPRIITAKKYFAYDVREGEYLTSLGDVNEKLYPASITKLLTVHTLLKYMEPAETVVVGDAMTLVHPDSSIAGIKEGDSLTVEQLIAAMMLPSGNDAAQVAAVAAGRKIAENDALSAQDAMQAFVKKMNKEAEKLGMKNSHFENPDGFHHENHYTTMGDLVKLCEAVLANERILKHTSQASDAVTLTDRTLQWNNTNMLLQSQGKTYIPATIGLKTGYTDAAGSCLISAFFREDRIWLVGVFGCPAYTEDRYLDTVAIYNSL